MALTRVTPRRPLPRGSTPERHRRYFLNTRRYWNESLRRYLTRYYQAWIAVHPYGVSSTEAMIQLCDHLPFEWQEWAWSQVEAPAQSSLTEGRMGSSFLEFLNVLRRQIASEGYPPDGPHDRIFPNSQELRLFLGLPPSERPWVAHLGMGDGEPEVIDTAGPEDPSFEGVTGTDVPIVDVLRGTGSYPRGPDIDSVDEEEGLAPDGTDWDIEYLESDDDQRRDA